MKFRICIESICDINPHGIILLWEYITLREDERNIKAINHVSMTLYPIDEVTALYMIIALNGIRWGFIEFTDICHCIISYYCYWQIILKLYLYEKHWNRRKENKVKSGNMKYQKILKWREIFYGNMMKIW